MFLHLVGGFLGSGKTTAIIAATKQLMARGLKVGVVTNDQGKYLVDTAFFQAAAIPTVEVSGGCFCCHYDDLAARLSELKSSQQPDVIFAESVGSCADMVATVLKPLQQVQKAQIAPTSFSVFGDIRLLRRRLQRLPLPFSEDVLYIFDKQLEEAGILVLNKADLLSESERTATVALTQTQFPGKIIQLQNSFDANDVHTWLNLLNATPGALPATSLTIDYQRYGHGERQLAWLDEELIFTPPAGAGRTIVRNLLWKLSMELQQRQLAIGHLKFFIICGTVNHKLSFISLTDNAWQESLPDFPDAPVRILINARVETAATTLHEVLQTVLTQTLTQDGIPFQESALAAFHPGFPKPTHRIA